MFFEQSALNKYPQPVSTPQVQRRMSCPQQGDHVLLRDVRVALRSGNGSVTQEFLDDADVHAIAKQQRCHRMAQHVRSNVPLDSRLLTQLGNYVGDSLG